MSIYSKRDVVSEMLGEGGVVALVIDGKRQGVRVPEDQKTAPLILEYGYSMAIPMPDLKLDDDGVSATLSFNRSPFATFVPWSAVIAVVQDGRIQIMWEVPEEKAGLSLVGEEG